MGNLNQLGQLAPDAMAMPIPDNLLENIAPT